MPFSNLHGKRIPLINNDLGDNQDRLEADALVLSCVDFRLNDNVACVLAEKGLTGRYDLVALAGGSLAVTNDLFPSFSATFWAHVAFLKNLHNFKRIIIIDHRNCGMYRMVFGRDLSKTPDEERELHMKISTKLKGQIEEKYPELQVEIWLMALDGTIEITS